MIQFTAPCLITVAAFGFTLHDVPECDRGFAAVEIASNSGVVPIANFDAVGLSSQEALTVYQLQDPTAMSEPAEPPKPAFTSTKATEVNCSVESSSGSTEGTCSVPEDSKTCSTMKGNHDGGHQCSTLGNTPNVAAPKCSVVGAHQEKHKCSTWGKSVTGNTDACSVLNDSKDAAVCSVTEDGDNEGSCSAMAAETSTTQKCSVVEHSGEGSCSVERDSKARCTVLSGPAGSCSVHQGTGSCSFLGEAGTSTTCNGDRL